MPMTRHDLAVTSFRAWWRRAYRSGIAYAEVAERMRRRGDRGRRDPELLLQGLDSLRELEHRDALDRKSVV